MAFRSKALQRPKPRRKLDDWLDVGKLLQDAVCPKPKLTARSKRNVIAIISTKSVRHAHFDAKGSGIASEPLTAHGGGNMSLHN